MKSKNMFCQLKDLNNESSVEQFFVNRLIEHLGFQDGQIKTKESIESVLVSRGRKKINYKPDYIILEQRKPLLIIEAKATNESIANWIDQCSGYCFDINKRRGDKPVKYFVITNGVKLSLFEWDSILPIIELDFDDFTVDNSKFKQLFGLISAKKLKLIQESSVKSEIVKTKSNSHSFRRISIDEINVLFSACHQKIYQKDNCSQAAAFMEFVKLMFLKLLSDKKVHTLHQGIIGNKQEYSVPSKDVQFSIKWIDNAEETAKNPVSTILFQDLKADLESQILSNEKKRMFDKTEMLNLNAETIRVVVEKLEHIDLYSIDSDLNGRLFETFLGATMRGKDLGQYFTPRSVVKLMIELANIKILNGKIDEIPTVIDPCCGSGGFLIDALWNIWEQIDSNESLSKKDKEKLKKQVAQKKLIGMDIGKDPAIARVARINMYLHGDGGSRIYQVDSLAKQLNLSGVNDPEIRLEYTEINQIYEQKDGFADLVITNPPFSKNYESKHPPEKLILDAYSIAKYGQKKQESRDSVKTNILFFEKYYDVLNQNGTVVAIVDDSILGSDSYSDVRKWIKDHFLVIGIISLPGDAFQRSNARVKTSIIVLRKRENQEQENPPVYMNYCIYVGVDDPKRQRVLAIDRKNRRLAQEEIKKIAKSFKDHCQGKSQPGLVVPFSKIYDRMDVKSCLINTGRQVQHWINSGLQVCTIRETLNYFDENNLEDDDVLITNEAEDSAQLLRVTYSGEVIPGEEISPSDSNYSHLLRVHTNDIVISNINAVHGAIGVVGEDCDGLYVTSEYTICRAKSGYDPIALWLILRSPEVRSDFLVTASGMGRTRIKWDTIKNIKIPTTLSTEAAKEVDSIKKQIESKNIATKGKKDGETNIQKLLELDTSKARKIIDAFKPPK